MTSSGHFCGYVEKCDPELGCFKTPRMEQNFGTLNPNGYKYKIIKLHLKDSGKVVNRRVHRAVYESMTRQLIPDGLHCMHLNDDRTDNRFCNLRLGTPSENNRMKTNIRPRSRPNKKMPVIAIDELGNRQHFESHSECARKLGGSRPSIGKILDDREMYKYNKFFWGRGGKKFSIIKAQ